MTHDYRNRLSNDLDEHEETLRLIDWVILAVLVIGGIWILASAAWEVWRL